MLKNYLIFSATSVFSVAEFSQHQIGLILFGTTLPPS